MKGTEFLRRIVIGDLGAFFGRIKERNIVLDIVTLIFHKSTASQTSWREYFYSQPTKSQKTKFISFFKTFGRFGKLKPTNGVLSISA